MSRLVALGDHVIVRVPPREAETKTTGGIVIPSTVTTDAEKTGRGVVVSAGAGSKDYPAKVTAGDECIFPAHAGTEIKHEGEVFVVLRHAQIIAQVS